MLYEESNWKGIKDDKTYVVDTGGSYPIELVLSGEVVNLCYHSGDCFEDVERCMELPEIKSQLEAIDEDYLNKWWEEDMWLDESEEEHKKASKQRKLMWVLFSCASFCIDGYCEYYSGN